MAPFKARIESENIHSYIVFYKKLNRLHYINHVCFSDISGSKDSEYNIALFHNNRSKNPNKNHFILLHRREVDSYLKLLQKIIGGFTFKHTRINDVFNNKFAIEISIDFKKMKIPHTSANRLLILTLFRYVTEFPYNKILKKAFYLREKYDGLFNLLDWLMIAHIGENYGEGHCLYIAQNYPDINGKYKNDEKYKFKRFKIAQFKKDNRGLCKNKIFDTMPDFTKEDIKLIRQILNYENTSSGRPSLFKMD